MPDPTLERERALWAKGFQVVAGLDEVGRGPIAGPVIAAAVVLPPGQQPIDGLRDSKLLSAKQRERLADEIRRAALAWALGGASVREIDRVTTCPGFNVTPGRSMRGPQNLKGAYWAHK